MRSLITYTNTSQNSNRNTIVFRTSSFKQHTVVLDIRQNHCVRMVNYQFIIVIVVASTGTGGLSLSISLHLYFYIVWMYIFIYVCMRQLQIKDSSQIDMNGKKKDTAAMKQIILPEAKRLDLARVIASIRSSQRERYRIRYFLVSIFMLLQNV